ncbi:unnamed protein product [Durusdinium trenchii]|uniref:Uncharacterized protein n=1 Tax=Durusdinium trenchii TaxID=1381693 RepID=A0ABP0PGH6_9DINO
MNGGELQVTNEAVYNDAVRVTKIFSGIFFFGLAAWLSMANGTKLSFIQQVYVGAFSAFFNFFQLTEVDDILLDRASSFTLDFSRPLEWIMTCPLMQLALVLMGGSRIPEYRRMLMPGLSVAVLVCGTASMLLFDVWVYVAYGVGILFASVMFFLNRLQIIEHSDGQECLMFRKASILLIVTWIPFPTFYALSPEGFGIINDVLFVQVGWAFLNIVSKFTFIFYIQRIKDNYCNRLKVKREFAGVQSAAPKGPTVNADGTITPPLSGMALAQSKQAEKAQSEMGALVVETMNFLGMAQNSERFLRLLQHSNVTSLRHLECLSQDECLKLQLPWDLVAAVQKRLRVWKLEMQDEAELALEQGELHYQMEEPVNPLKNSTLVDKLHAVQAAGQESHPQVQYAPPLPGMVADDSRIQRIEEALTAMQQQNEFFQTEILKRLSEQPSPSHQVSSPSGSLKQTIEMTVQATLKNKDMESFVEHRIEELICAAQVRIEQAADKVSEGLRAQAREVQGTIERARESESTFIAKMDEKLQLAVEEVTRSAETSRRNLSDFLKEARVTNEARNDTRRQEDFERAIARKFEETNARILEKQDRVAEFLRGAIQNDMNTVMSRSDMVVDVVKENGAMVKESLGDLKRLNINILDVANSNQEMMQQSLHRSSDLRSMVESQMQTSHDRGGGRPAYDGGSPDTRSPNFRSDFDRPLSGGNGGRRYDSRTSVPRGLS